MSRITIIHANEIQPAWQITGQALSPIAPLMLLPIGASLLAFHRPAWQLMWLLALSIYAGLKWLTFATWTRAGQAPSARALAYLLLWPGMNARAFFDLGSRASRPTIRESLFVLLKLALGAALLYAVVPALRTSSPLAAGWTALIGLALLLHFGLFHLLSICWRLLGISAEPLMHAPLLATSLSDFWGRRWNLAFRHLAFQYVFRPLIGNLGVAGATITVFLVSGLIHDLVISLPVNAGYGGPTIYFALQGAGLLLERSPLGQRLGFGSAWIGRLFAALVILGPLGLLFHQPFVLHAVLPTAAALTSF